MDELIDVLDADGNYTGETILKSVAHKNGVFHPTVHIWFYTTDLIDCEFHHTYIVELTTPLQRLKKQESEVEDLQLIALFKFSEETWGLANIKKYVPHSSEYYKTIIKAIKKEL